MIPVFALGHDGRKKINFLTPLWCRLFGELKTDHRNGCRMYTWRGVTLLLPKPPAVREPT